MIVVIYGAIAFGMLSFMLYRIASICHDINNRLSGLWSEVYQCRDTLKANENTLRNIEDRLLVSNEIAYRIAKQMKEGDTDHD